MRGVFCGHRKSDRVCDALPERSGSYFDARGGDLRVTGCFGVQTPEAFQIVHAQIVSAKIEVAIHERACVPAREYDAVAIQPRGIFRVVADLAHKDAHYVA